MPVRGAGDRGRGSFWATGPGLPGQAGGEPVSGGTRVCVCRTEANGTCQGGSRVHPVPPEQDTWHHRDGSVCIEPVRFDNGVSA